MKRIKFFVLYILFFIIFQFDTVKAQSIEFLDIYLEPDTVTSGNFKGYEAYYLDELVIYRKLKNAKDFLVMDKSTNVEIYSFQNPIPKSEFTKPRFFDSNQADQPVIVLLDVSKTYSLGIHMFIIENATVNYCGFLEFAADNFNFSSLALYAHFVRNEGKLLLTFDDVDIIDHMNEQLVDGDDLVFEIQNYQIQRIENHN